MYIMKYYTDNDINIKISTYILKYSVLLEVGVPEKRERELAILSSETVNDVR